MASDKEFLTIGSVGKGEYTEKKSRFLGEIHPVKDEQEAAEIVAQASQVPKKLNAYKNQKELQEDVRSQLDRLFPKNFLVSVPAKSLSHYPRYLSAICWRLEKYRDSPDSDKEKMDSIHRLEYGYQRKISELRGQKDNRLEEFRWLLEELRVSLFAQRLRTPMPVSVKRLQKVWDTICH